MKPTLLALALAVAAAGCGESAQEKAVRRLAAAEARMDACKKEVGLPDAPTPQTSHIVDPADQGKPFTPERLVAMRIKVECLIPLTELLEARRAVEKGR